MAQYNFQIVEGFFHRKPFEESVRSFRRNCGEEGCLMKIQVLDYRVRQLQTSELTKDVSLIVTQGYFSTSLLGLLMNVEFASSRLGIWEVCTFRCVVRCELFLCNRGRIPSIV